VRGHRYSRVVATPAGRGFAPRPITTASAAAQIAEQLRTAIMRGDLQPGHRLPSEIELAADYAVSRGTIRETMKILSSAQLVETARGAAGGTFVRVPEPGSVAAAMGDTISLWFAAGSTTLAEVNAAREWIERGCVMLATVNRDAQDLEAIGAAVEAMEAPGLTMDDMLAIDIDFHVAISRAAHNAVLELAMNAIHLVRPYTNTMLLRKRTPEPGEFLTFSNSIIIPPVALGKNCTLTNCIVGPNVTVGENSKIHDAIIRDSIIGAFSEIENVMLHRSVVGSDAKIVGRSKALNIGDDTEIDLRS